MRVHISNVLVCLTILFLVFQPASAQQRKSHWPETVDRAIKFLKADKSQRRAISGNAKKVATLLATSDYRYLLAKMSLNKPKLVHHKKFIRVAMSVKKETKSPDPFGGGSSKKIVETITYANLVRQQQEWQLAGLSSVVKNSDKFTGKPFSGKDPTPYLRAIEQRNWVKSTPRFLVDENTDSFMGRAQTSLQEWNKKPLHLLEYEWTVVELPIPLDENNFKFYLLIKDAGNNVDLTIRFIHPLFADPLHETTVAPQTKLNADETSRLVRQVFVQFADTPSLYRKLLNKNQPRLIGPALSIAMNHSGGRDFDVVICRLASQQGKYSKPLLGSLFNYLCSCNPKLKEYRAATEAIQLINADLDNPLPIIDDLKKQDKYQEFGEWLRNMSFSAAQQFSRENRRKENFKEYLSFSQKSIESMTTRKACLQQLVDHLPNDVASHWNQIGFLPGLTEAKVFRAIKQSITQGTTRDFESAVAAYEKLGQKLKVKTKEKMLAECFFEFIQTPKFKFQFPSSQQQIITHLAAVDWNAAQKKTLISVLNRMVNEKDKLASTIQKPIFVSVETRVEAKLALINLGKK